MILTRLIKPPLILFLVLIGTAHATSETDISSSTPTPYVGMNIGIEISGLEQAAEKAAQGFILIGESLDKLADNHELTSEQNQQIQQTLLRVDELGQNLNQTLNQLPVTVKKGISPIVTAGNELSDELKQILIIACVVLILIILSALAAVYYFVLAPATRSVIETTRLLNDLANTLEIAASIVDKASEQNLLVMQELHKQQLKTPRENISAKESDSSHEKSNLADDTPDQTAQ